MTTAKIELEFAYRRKDLRQAIRQARKGRGWSYAEVARQSGVDLRVVLHLFQGAANTEIRNVEAIMRALAVKLYYRGFASDDCLAVLLHTSKTREMPWSKAIRLAGLDRRFGSQLKHQKAGARLYTVQPLMKALGVQAVF
ncbi:MAG: helix-turn-helix domain-containing protein [Phycisphaerales bacterium]